MYQIRMKQYKGSIPVREETWPIDEALDSQTREFSEFPCRVSWEKKEEGEGTLFSLAAEALTGTERPVSLSLEYIETDWKKKNYVFLPAAAYDGNRMESRYLPYPPYSARKDENGWVPVITDIPHLSVKDTDSRIQFLAGDMSTPAMGYYDWEKGQGFLLFARHRENGRYTGFSVGEKGIAGQPGAQPAETAAQPGAQSVEAAAQPVYQAVFAVSAPGVREDTVYFFGELPDGSGFYPTCGMPSEDEGTWLKAGEKLTLTVRSCRLAAENISAYFRAFNERRECLERGEDFASIPFSKAYNAVKEKYISMNFDPEGYYRVGAGQDNPPSFWQAGWVGGGMNSFPLLVEDKGLAREQAKSTIRFIAEHLQEENGWYVPMYAKGKKYGDAFTDGEAPILLVRKASDLLYFMVKQAMYLRRQGESMEQADASIRAQADAFVRFVKKNGELGQFIDMKSETLAMGGTACAASAMAALALAYEYLGETEYLETAEYLGRLYKKEALDTGIANGCPGEICQACDSEAAFGLLEGYVQLYETTGREEWLENARDAFELAITWVVSYDFIFPKGRTAEKLHAHTRGTVFANAQNKHSAPGICTWSGNSMLKLYRFTGDVKYLEWMRRISHALSQFVSLKERPVDTLAGKPLVPGYFNERVQTSDWEGKHTVGEFLYGSNWPEVTMLLTYVEIPGIYVDVDRDVLVVNDHVSVKILSKTETELVLKVSNDTPYDARVTVMVDHSEAAEALGHLYFCDMEKLEVAAGESREFKVKL